VVKGEGGKSPPNGRTVEENSRGGFCKEKKFKKLSETVNGLERPRWEKRRLKEEKILKNVCWEKEDLCKKGKAEKQPLRTARAPPKAATCLSVEGLMKNSTQSRGVGGNQAQEGKEAGKSKNNGTKKKKKLQKRTRRGGTRRREKRQGKVLNDARVKDLLR